MTELTRRILLGGAFATLALPAFARDDDPRPIVSIKPVRTAPPHAARRQRFAVPPENAPNTGAYQGHNRVLLAQPASARRVVLMGDSITYAWGNFERDLFRRNGIIDRGIGGETSAQMLLRFKGDVIDIAPQAVHIMAGTNDLAAARRPFDGDLTRRNIAAMATQAHDKGIAVILASVPPAVGFPPSRGEPGNIALRKLNAWIKDLCEKDGYTYCDYWPAIRAPGDRLKPGYGKDSAHPNATGYAAMTPVLLAAIDTALKAKAG